MRGQRKLECDLTRAIAGAFALLLALCATAASEPDRDRTLVILEELAASPTGFELRVWINDGKAAPIQIGDTIQYHLSAARAAHLTLVHVDYHGVVTVVFPNDIGLDTRLAAGRERVFPSPEEGFALQAEPPLGSDFVLAIATAEPLSLEMLGLSTRGLPLAILESSAAPAFAERLAARFAALPTADRAAARVEQRIVGRTGEIEYDSADIVAFFETRTRSIARPRLDLHVHFASGSDVLDATARANLDVVADALSAPTLRAARFAVNGHTDDVGDFVFNDDLSQRRAASVARYLSEQREIDPTRLEVRYFGETQPLQLDTSPTARQLNRRVEFELLR